MPTIGCGLQLAPGLAAATGLTQLEMVFCEELSLDNLRGQLLELLPRWPLLKVSTCGRARGSGWRLKPLQRCRCF